jgi:hypothetical protein
MILLLRRTLVHAAALLPIAAALVGLEAWFATITDDHVSAAMLVMILATITLSLAAPVF